MTKDDVMRAATGRPVPFHLDRGEAGEFECLLRPLSFGERRELFAWSQAHGREEGSGLELQQRLVLAAVCDERARPLLEPADVAAFDVEVVERLAAEIARRNGMDGRAAGEPGKGASPTTPN